MYKMIIIGAGPAGISMAVESIVNGMASEEVLVIEKAPQHSFSIRKYYPENKLVTANYKGFEAVCTGALCIPDLTKHETISYLDRAIEEYRINVNYEESVWRIHHHPEEGRFSVITDRDEYTAEKIVVAIGILGKPNKPEYKLPSSLSGKLLFDITSSQITGAKVLVVGGGDTASEYCQYLEQHSNNVTLSYRREGFTRMNYINKQSIETLAAQNRVKILFNSDVSEVQDSAGRAKVFFRNAEIQPEEFDYVVYALGGTTPENFLKSIGIEFIGKEPALNEGHETNIPGMFLIGDLSAGSKGGSIIWAFNSANTVIRKISTDGN